MATKSSGFFTAAPGVAGGSVEVLSTVPDKAAPRPHGRPVGVETLRELEAGQRHLPRGARDLVSEGGWPGVWGISPLPCLRSSCGHQEEVSFPEEAVLPGGCSWGWMLP